MGGRKEDEGRRDAKRSDATVLLVTRTVYSSTVHSRLLGREEKRRKGGLGQGGGREAMLQYCWLLLAHHTVV